MGLPVMSKVYRAVPVNADQPPVRKFPDNPA